MHPIVLKVEVAQISAGPRRHCIAAHVRVRVAVELHDRDDLPMAAIAKSSGAFDWLRDEPDRYSKADVIAASRP